MPYVSDGGSTSITICVYPVSHSSYASMHAYGLDGMRPRTHTSFGAHVWTYGVRMILPASL